MGRVAVVWGLGNFDGGLAACLHLHQSGASVRIIDRTPREQLATSLRRLRDLGGPADPEVLQERPEALDGAELLVVNPAIRPGHRLLDVARSRGIPCTQELDLFLGDYPGNVIAVTGTNGKSTTTAMTAAVLRGALGHESVLVGGNIGRSLLLDRPRWRSDQWAVVEVSSFQASRLRVRPGRLTHAVFTPITSDHLDWHGGLEDYRRSKLRLADFVAPGGAVIGLARCSVFATLQGRLPPGASWTRIRRGSGAPVPDERELGIDVDFDVENAMLAIAAGREAGVATADAIAAVRSFGGLPHRLQNVGSRDGIGFVDNAASTIVETSLGALRSLASRGPVRWICGGRAKGRIVSGHLLSAGGLAASVHAFGEVAPALADALGGCLRSPVTRHAGLTEALDAAWDLARPGDLLLLSPGFSSHDQYPNFVARAGDALDWWRDLRRPPGRERLGTAGS